MHKWPIWLAFSLSVLGVCSPTFARDDHTLPAGGALVCMPLIQQGELNPPAVTTHLDTLKLCMNNCDVLYQSLGDQGYLDEMLRSANNCRKSLNNLYFASVAQTNIDQLNQQTEQQNAADKRSAFESLSAAMSVKERLATPAQPEVDASPEATTHSTAPPPSPPPVLGPSDNINW